MIFYFSGTGNSYYAAKKIAEVQEEKLVNITDEMNKEENTFYYPLEYGEKLGFVFPVYAWAIPKIVLEFIRNCNFKSDGTFYTFAVCTCGGSAGNTIEQLKKELTEKQIILNSGFSVVMPDNFVVGMNVPNQEKAKEILKKSEITLEKINKVIQHQKQDFFKVKKGSFNTVKSQIVSHLFQAFATKTKKFYATNACISCGLCERVCTSNAISLDGKPVWIKKRCNMCLACINQCPKKAIQYGKCTIKRNRYVNPNT